jgi:hypothetical protein
MMAVTVLTIPLLLLIRRPGSRKPVTAEGDVPH